jgi:hypothetical protein
MSIRMTSKRLVSRVTLGFAIVFTASLLTGVAEAAVGDVLKTVILPAGALCGTDSGSAVAIVPGGKLGFPTFPTLLVTSCQNKLFFVEPSTGTLIRTINTVTQPGSVPFTPTAGWQALTLRPDRADILGCGIVSGQVALYAIDFLPSPNTVIDGTVTFLGNPPAGSGATCDGVAWDQTDPVNVSSIYLSSSTGPSTSKLILHLSEAVPAPGLVQLGTVSSGCNALTGVTVSATSLFVTCANGSTINRLNKTDGTLMTSFNAGTNQPGDSECDPVTLVLPQTWHPGIQNKDVIWVKTKNAAQAVAVQAAFGTCGPAPPPPVCPITVSNPNGDNDSDGDGLLDCWEDGTLWADGRPGIALDGVYGTSTVPRQQTISNRFTLCVDLGPQATGEMSGTIGFGPTGGACASKDAPDILVEIDYMPFHQPNVDSVQDVVNVFSTAPTPIRLHVQVGDNVGIHSDRIALVPCTGLAPAGSPTAGDADFDTLKATWFGTGTSAQQRNDPPGPRLNARNWVYHYAIWAHNQEPIPPSTATNTSSGCAELPGNDFIVTMGSWGGSITGHTGGIGTRTEQSGTFMHELGHNLNLRHGGGDSRSLSQVLADLTKPYVDRNCKPNYVSVMNYAYQMNNTVADRPLNYSDRQLLSLNEGNLTESQGVGTLYNGNIAFGQPVGIPAKPSVKLAGGAISWDLDTNTTETGIMRDLNNMTSSAGACPSSAPTSTTADVLDGFNDWSNIQLNFRASTDFAGGVGLTFDTDKKHGNQDITRDEHLAISRDRCDVKSSATKNNVSTTSNPVLNGTFFSRNENGVAIVDATQLDRDTLRLSAQDGSWTLVATASKCALKDVNHDNLLDLACPFDVPQGTSITAGPVVCTGEIPNFLPPNGPSTEYDFVGLSNVQ